MTRKLKLSLDALDVTSFDLDAAAGERGTVVGASDPQPIPETEDPFGCTGTVFTGPCCDVTLALSCVQTGCDECIRP